MPHNYVRFDRTETVDGIVIHPLENHRIMVDVPGLPVDNIHIRANAGHLHLTPEGWKVNKPYFGGLTGLGGTVTRRREGIFYAEIERVVSDWASANADVLAEADKAWRNNDAFHLERQIADHQTALEILFEHLLACERGNDYDVYPDIPTKRH